MHQNHILKIVTMKTLLLLQISIVQMREVRTFTKE